MQRLECLADRYREQHDCAWSEIPLAAALAQADIACSYGGTVDCLSHIDAAEVLARRSGRGLLTVRLGWMRAIVALRLGRHDNAIRQARELLHAMLELGLGRVVQDLQFWTAFEVDQLHVPDAFVQISSIMPLPAPRLPK